MLGRWSARNAIQSSNEFLTGLVEIDELLRKVNGESATIVRLSARAHTGRKKPSGEKARGGLGGKVRKGYHGERKRVLYHGLVTTDYIVATS